MEHWLGLKTVYGLTNAANYSLRVSLEDQWGNTSEVFYNNFKLDFLVKRSDPLLQIKLMEKLKESVFSTFQNYTLNISGYVESPAGNALGGHNGHPFTTKDNDNDSSSGNCAVIFKGAWRYTACHSSNLNGLNKNNATADYALSITWSTWTGQYHSLKSVQMAIKRNL